MTENTIKPASSPNFSVGPIPARAGVGLKAEHYHDILENRPDIGWFEVHPENYMGAGGPPHKYLEAIRRDYPLSLHGVGLSLGSAEPVSSDHLARLALLIERYEPALVSEHVSWSMLGGTYYNDLLPLPYTEETMGVLSDNISRTQDALGRTILVENPSTYVEFEASQISEPEFLLEVARRTGCGLLLDINNVFVCARNHGFDPDAYLATIPPALVGEIHMAGHAVETKGNRELRIDDHGSPVIDEVWALYADYMARAPHVPTLIEWDRHIPAWDILLSEAQKADTKSTAARSSSSIQSDAKKGSAHVHSA